MSDNLKPPFEAIREVLDQSARLLTKTRLVARTSSSPSPSCETGFVPCGEGRPSERWQTVLDELAKNTEIDTRGVAEAKWLK